MKNLKKIRDYFWNSRIPVYVINLAVIIIAGYEVYSYFILKIPLSFESIIFVVILMVIIISSLFRMKYCIDPDRYWEVVDKIRFSNTRQGTDGICCFLSFKDFGVPLPRKKDKILIRAALTKNPDAGQTIEDVINSNSIKLFGHGKRCINLQMDYEIKGENLEFNFGCGNYEGRPEACHKYPANNCGSCRLSEYASTPAEQVKHFKWSMIFLYAFDKKKYPQFENYSAGTAGNYFRQYYLVPVPFRNIKNMEKILCK